MSVELKIRGHETSGEGRPGTERSPLITFFDRRSDSPLVERVWRSYSNHGGVFHSIASPNWDIVVTRLNGRTTLTMHGPETKATLANCPAEGEWFGIRFKVGAFMPLIHSDSFRDRNDITLPNATGRSFWLNGAAWDFPNFENAETFVNRLIRAGLIATDRSVEGALCGKLQNVTTRTEQRRVLRVTGLTRGAICQIERARQATILLQRGTPIADVVYQAGFYDQAHLTRSLKRFIGLTPGRIPNGTEQLSFLYNK